MLVGGEIFKGLGITSDDFHCCGTPEQLQTFLKHLWENPTLVEPRRFCFDLDSTLVTLPQISGDYKTCLPIECNIQLLRNLKHSGHYIIINTARRMKTHKGDVAAVIKDIGQLTKDSLEKYGYIAVFTCL